MKDTEHSPSVSASVAAVLQSSPHPLHVDELLHKVTTARPVHTTTRRSLQRALDELYQAVPVGSGRYGWLANLLQGNVFCHPLNGDELRRGHLLLDELEHSVFFPQFFQDFQPDGRVVEISLFGGPTLSVEAVIERKTWSLRLGSEYVDWLSEIGAESRDDVLIKVRDAVQGQYSLKARLREMRDERAIERRNVRLAVLAEQLVAEDSRTRDVMPTWDLVAQLIGRGSFENPPPPDDLHYVLHEYSGLRFSDGIGYRLEGAASARYRGHNRDEQDTPDEHSNDRVTQKRRDASNARAADGAADLSSDWEQDWFAADDYDDEEDDQICPAYEQYLESYAQDHGQSPPLQHDEFHLLEAELDLLLQLEAEFGGLLPEQEMRKEALAERLYIDPDSLASMGWDAPDDPNLEDPPFWSN